VTATPLDPSCGEFLPPRVATQHIVILPITPKEDSRDAVIASCHDINLAARFASHVLLLGEDFYYAGGTQEVLNPDVLSRVYGCEFDDTATSIVAV
jgi:iron complex transport system ATP-binding protein